MGWLVLEFGTYLGFCSTYLTQSVMVFGSQAFLLSGHALIACRHELPSVLLPCVKGCLLFLF